MDTIIPYYEDKTRISNSDIGTFLRKGPRALKESLDGKERESTPKYFEKGTMIHMYLLEPDEFWDNYIILDFEKPSSAAQIKFCEELVNTFEIEPNRAVLSAFQASYSTRGKSEDKMLSEGLEMAQKLSQYIEYLKTSKNTNKTIISFADLAMLKTIKKNVTKHKKANELLFDLTNTCETHNEFHINWYWQFFNDTYCDGSIDCKSLLDRVIVDHENKKIILVDVKTTADVHGFEKSIESFDYTRQLAYYTMALQKHYQDIWLDYTMEHYIVAIQSNDSYEVRVIRFSQECINEQYPKIIDALADILWHKETNQWDHRKEYYEGDGSETFI